VVVGPRTSQFVFIKIEDFQNMADLKAFARKYHREIAELLNGIDEKREAELVEVPWFKALKISRRQALTQYAMHSHYHRGQNATRLRELGGVPPATDFIMWLSQGQPPARWSWACNDWQAGTPPALDRL
jgi:uncharacterized damage-inducible protein DinB